jgi:mannose-6-phosphate isomerase
VGRARRCVRALASREALAVAALEPVPLPPNQLVRFYRGGRAIARFRGIEPVDDRAPEDWVGSTTTVFGERELGLSRLADGRVLRDAVAGDPEGFLGPRQDEPGLLVKLLDAGERLPVHCHPDRSFSQAHLGSRYGKTEAWLILETSVEPASVWLGFRDGVDADELSGWVGEQDVDRLLGGLNELSVAPGDVVYVPAGLPHAIGEGIFMVEVQEPSDFSVLLEWRGFDIDGAAEGHLGLGWPAALAAVDRSPWAPERAAALRRGTPPGQRVSVLPPEVSSYFRAERVRPAPLVRLEPAFSLLVVVGGTGVLEWDSGSLELRHGDTVLIPHGAGTCALAGAVDAVRCLPPA